MHLVIIACLSAALGYQTASKNRAIDQAYEIRLQFGEVSELATESIDIAKHFRDELEKCKTTHKCVI